jgi:ElaB/YqjD/DUF883 family membrane-anchored ribosome-binding protein
VCAAEQTSIANVARLITTWYLPEGASIAVSAWLQERGLAVNDFSGDPGQELRPTTNGKPNNEKVHSMLSTIAVVLIVLWLLGLVTSYTMGGFIHILLVVAVIMVLLNLINGRRSVWYSVWPIDQTPDPHEYVTRVRIQAATKAQRSMQMNTRELETDAERAQVATARLMRDFRVLAADMEQLLKVTASQTGGHIAQVRAKAEESLQAWKARATDLQDVALTKTRAAGQATDDYVHANPWQAIAICAVAGLVLGTLITRGGASDT